MSTANNLDNDPFPVFTPVKIKYNKKSCVFIYKNEKKLI